MHAVHTTRFGAGQVIGTVLPSKRDPAASTQLLAWATPPTTGRPG